MYKQTNINFTSLTCITAVDRSPSQCVMFMRSLWAVAKDILEISESVEPVQNDCNNELQIFTYIVMPTQTQPRRKGADIVVESRTF